MSKYSLWLLKNAFSCLVYLCCLLSQQYHVDGPRIEAAFRKYFHRADKSQTQQSHELLVAHGNVLRYFILRCCVNTV